MTVRDVIKMYPRGTEIDVWVRDWGGPSYLGRFTVETRTLRHTETGLTWGELVKDVARDNHGMKLVIAMVKEQNKKSKPFHERRNRTKCH